MIDAHWKQIILSLLHLSQDHVADALRSTWGELPVLPVRKSQVSASHVDGWIHENLFEIHTLEDSQGDVKIEFFQNGQSMCDFKLIRHQSKFKLGS
ncbi:MAG: hypothetical protein ACK5P7_06255 [Bdellovibrio sp.]